MKTLIVMFSATGMLLSSGWSFAGECSSEVVEFIRLKGGTKEGALSRISNEVSDAKRSYAAGTWGKGQVSGAERKELFDFMMQETSEMISNIRTCTERDLASITPKAKGTQSSSAASNCPAQSQKIVVKNEGGETGYSIASSNPLNIRRIAPDNQFGDYENGTSVTNVFKEIERWKGVISSCPEPCLGYNDSRRALIKWLQCAAGNNVNSDSNRTANTQAEQIPNCPPTLPPSCVTWSLYDQQLQEWNLTNNCGRDVSVTFRSEGALGTTLTFGHGESYRTKWRGSNPPKQIVWDATKGVGFYRNKPAGAALKCGASLPL